MSSGLGFAPGSLQSAIMTLAKVVRKGSYQGVPQWGINTASEITPSKATAEKWAQAENADKVGRSKAAKARKIGESTTYQVHVIGHAWGGFKGTYGYFFDHEPTEQEINAKAGDFESLIDWQIISVRTIQYNDGERRIVSVVRDWHLSDSADFYCDANGC